MEHWAGSFYINDGSPIVDSSPPDPRVMIDAQSLGGWQPPLGSYVTVTGISGMETLSGSPIRSLRPRGVSDVQISGADAAYIYSGMISEATAYQDLLNSRGIRTDLVSYTSIPSTDWSKYDVILIGGDTGTWSSTSVVNTVLGANTPIVALGDGGAMFLDAVPGLFIGWGQSAIGNDYQGVVVGGSIYTYPNDLGVSVGSTISLYAGTVSTVRLYDPSGTSDRMLRCVSASSYYPVAREAGRYYQWGYNGSPIIMTATGKNVFTNLVFRTLMP